MCFMYCKLRVFLEREKVRPKELKDVIFFIYSIYERNNIRKFEGENILKMLPSVCFYKMIKQE